MTPPKVHNSSKTESKDTEMVEMQNKEHKSILLKLINDLKEDSNKQIKEVKKSIQDLTNSTT
jgi:hypothetical protein